MPRHVRRCLARLLVGQLEVVEVRARRGLREEVRVDGDTGGYGETGSLSAAMTVAT